MSAPPDSDVTTPEVSANAPSTASRASARRASRIGLLVVLLVPILENLPAIIGLVKYAPQATTSGIGFITKVGYLAGGQAFIDPNVGYNSQALGHAAAFSWLHGHVPWWNLYEGLGMPLAASIQSASFFPLVLLQALPQGSLWFHVAAEIAIGWATYALLRQLRCSPAAAAFGAIAFELNGSIAWLTNAPVNPVAFLPLSLLGVEYVMSAAASRRNGGWVLLAVSTWLSIVAGFPEVAVLNSALVGCWFLVRLVQRRREAGGVLIRGAVGVGVGVLLAAPVLNAFVRYLSVANVGRHTADVASITIPLPGAAQLITPYLFGGIFAAPVAAAPTVYTIWTETGGYTGAALMVLAVAGLLGARERAIRILLGAWALLFLGSSYNLTPFHQIVQHIPGLTHLAVFRYATSSTLLCLCILAALFLDEVGSLRPARLLARVVPGVAVAVGIFAIGFFASPSDGRVWSHVHLPRWYWGSLAILGLVVVVALGSVLLAATKWRRFVPIVLGVVLAAEAMAYFEVPILSFPRAVHYDTAVVDFLRANLGTQRFYTIEPVSPNYGTYYGIASLDAADLPIPKNWGTYVHTKLNPWVLPWQFGNGGPHGVGFVSPLVAMLTNLPNYEEAGVKYLVAPSGTHLHKYFQPRSGVGPATPNGGAVIAMSWRPPTYLVTGVLDGFELPLPSGVVPRLQVKACSAGTCVTARPVTTVSAPFTTSRGQPFKLDAPLRLGSALTIRLVAKPSAPVSILTVPSVYDSPAQVVADGVLLPGRGALLTFVYDPASLPILVRHTESSNVYRLPNPSPLATAPGCTVVAHTLTTFTTSCAAPSSMTYRALSFPGWRATVNGSSTPTTTTQGVFQQVALPAGTATVSFAYSPPKEVWAWLAAILGVIAIALGFFWRRLTRGARRLRHAAGQKARPASPSSAADESDAAGTADDGAAAGAAAPPVPSAPDAT